MTVPVPPSPPAPAPVPPSPSVRSVATSDADELVVTVQPGAYQPADRPLRDFGIDDTYAQLEASVTRTLLFDRTIEQDRLEMKRFQEDPKLLILGSGDSGKTTFLKNLHIHLGGGFTPEQLALYRVQMIDNMLNGMRILLNACRTMGYKISDVASRDLVLSYMPDGKQQGLPMNVIAAIHALWNTKAVYTAWKSGNKFGLQDNVEYFLDKVLTKGRPDYDLTPEDIVNIRHSTSSISETRFQYGKETLRFYDVAGQRSFRKTWASYFDSVNAVLFITSLASFDQQLEEEEHVNRMHDALLLFKEIANNPHLMRKPMLLFFNKRDILERKLRYNQVSTYFPDYKGPNEASAVTEFFKQRFLQFKSPVAKEPIVQVTCCTDVKAMAITVSVVS
ncbi:hypothetical protein HK105_203729 [Polyrhizophydium stewartii]|uniref:Uncharacterized protein n=1 Tax=Polyrhizophydium stewartii TaxID=2732419 RepID=A0ABR4NAQ8_9FUNG